MNRLAVGFIACVLSAVPAFGSTDVSAQQLLVNAKLKADLFSNQADAFELDVDYTAQQRLPAQGHFSLKWKDKTHWWRFVQLGDFKQIDVRNGGWLYTVRNATSTPVRVRQLFQLLQFGDGAEDLIAERQRPETEYGVQVDCLKVKQKHSKNTPHDVCLSATSHEISSDTWWDLPDSPTREEFADYFDFGSHRFPRSLQLVENGSRVIKANVKDLAVKAFDDALLTKPKDAIERRQCDNWKPPKAVKTPDVAYPPSASRNRSIGDSIVSMTVLADGSVTDIQLIGSAGHSMDDSTLRTLKTWKFKPAMCGTEPVVADIEVIVSFRMR